MNSSTLSFASNYDWERIPGAVSMVWTGSELITETAGFADIAAHKPMSPDTLFWIASNTKAIACALALRYVDRGLLDLDAPVCKYLPNWKDIKIKDGPAPSHPPTLRETMGHRAGLAFFPKMPITRWTVKELADMAANDGLDHDVGEYVYSNWGIDVAMAIVESVACEPWEKLLQKEVLDPLGMADTTFFPSPELCAARLAKSYRYDKQDHTLPTEMTVDQLVWPYNLPDAKAEAGGGLFSTAGDVMKFFRMIAGKGVDANGNRFLSEKIMEEWFGVTDYYRDLHYTFGANISRETGTIGHGGAYQTNAAANWKRGTVRVFMTQICGGNQQSRLFRADWEDYTSQWVGLKAHRPLLKIAVLSDNQGYPYPEDWGFSNTEKALKLLAPMKPDVVLNCGDIADGDNPSAVKYYVDMVKKYLGDIPQIACNGNHDLGLRAKRSGWEALADFQRNFGQNPDSQIVHEVIGDHDFISFSQVVNKPYTEEECKLIEAELDKAVARDSRKPIFVLTHYHPTDTVLDSSDGWGVNLRKLFNRYPQIISLSGHTHNPHQDPRNIWEGEFVAMETSTLSYGCHPGKYENMMSCLIPFGREAISFMFIEVFDNHMYIYRYNPESGLEIGDGDWYVPIPYKPSYAYYNAGMVNDRKAPQFGDDAKILFRYDFGFIYLIIDRAAKGDFVHDYRLAITEVDDNGNALGETKSYFYLDDFYRLPRCRDKRFILKAPPNSLSDGRRYRFDVYPRESFGLEGAPITLTVPVFKGYTFSNIPVTYPQE